MAIPTLYKKPHCDQTSSRCAYHSIGILSLISLVLISFRCCYILPSLNIPSRSNSSQGNPYRTLSFSSSEGYLFTLKFLETLMTLVAWLCTLKSAWKTIPATTFFIAFNFGAINLVLTVICGTCSWLLCPQSARCVVRPLNFLPVYCTFQTVTVFLLYFCTKASNRALHTTPKCRQLFYFCFGKVSTGLQLIGLFSAIFTGLMVLYVWLLAWYVVAYLQGEFTYTFVIVFLGLMLISRLILMASTFYGFKNKIPAFLVSSLFIGGLCFLLSVVLSMMAILYYVSTDYPYKKEPTDTCRKTFYIVLTFLLEMSSFRALILLYQRCKKMVYPIEFSDRLLRIPASKITCEKLLGKGQFGEVWYGKLALKCAKTSSSTCAAAVKRLKPSATAEMKTLFLEEAILLSRFDHENIIKPIGLCMDTKPELLSMEYLDGGSLSDYLHMDESRQWLGQSDLAEIIWQVAKACCYLESEGFIHRDIGARNCLISCQTVHGISKPVLVKLADFGLAKDVMSLYGHIYKCERSMIPVPYTAPEGINGNFGPKSDVWSFGVLAWEVFSWAARPFGKCYPSNGEHRCALREYTLEEIEYLVKVHHKSLLDLPDPCTASFTEPFRQFVKNCWKGDPNERPNFQEIKVRIEEVKSNSDNSPCFPWLKLKKLSCSSAEEYKDSSVQFSINFSTKSHQEADDMTSYFQRQVSLGSTYITLDVLNDACLNCAEHDSVASDSIV